LLASSPTLAARERRVFTLSFRPAIARPIPPLAVSRRGFDDLFLKLAGLLGEFRARPTENFERIQAVRADDRTQLSEGRLSPRELVGKHLKRSLQTLMLHANLSHLSDGPALGLCHQVVEHVTLGVRSHLESFLKSRQIALHVASNARQLAVDRGQAPGQPGQSGFELGHLLDDRRKSLLAADGRQALHQLEAGGLDLADDPRGSLITSLGRILVGQGLCMAPLCVRRLFRQAGPFACQLGEFFSFLGEVDLQILFRQHLPAMIAGGGIRSFFAFAGRKAARMAE
jgi:hypothetical protein